ncbi:MAG: branched-chain amino acid transport system substrate-binding protein [Chloroflexota bacterium]|jgi:branched-chain amino acid transport system substrate-binding protein|nr:branched-chain amino acid transport system substrate-binding protein [Chloroflexota bacterium]
MAPAGRRRGIAVLVAGLAAGSIAGCGSSSVAAPPNYGDRVLPIGAVISQTGIGDSLGKQQLKGIALASEVVNRARVNGARVEVSVEDDTSDRDRGTALFKTMVEEKKVYALVGPTLSNTALGALPVAEANHVPTVLVSSPGSGVVGTCASPCTYAFRDSLGEAIAIPALVHSAAERLHPTRAVILYANDDRPSFDEASRFEQAFKDNGIVNAGPEAPGISMSKLEGAPARFVARALEEKPNIVAVSAAVLSAAIVVELRKAGYHGPILGGNAFNTPSVAAATGEAGTDVQVPSGYAIGAGDSANRDFVDAYRAKYQEAPDQAAAQAYTAVLLVAEALRQANLAFTDLGADRERVRGALEKVSINTPLGPFAFTPAHDVSQRVWINQLDGKGGYQNVATVEPR